VDECPADMRGAWKGLNLFLWFPETQTRQGFPDAKGLQNFLESSVPVGFESGEKMSQTFPSLSDLSPNLGKSQSQWKPHLIGDPLGPSGREDPPEIPGRKGGPQGVLQHFVRFTESCAELEGIPIGIQPGTSETPSAHGDPDRGALMEVEVPADIPEPNPEQDGA
jgi:hypothetical protein